MRNAAHPAEAAPDADAAVSRAAPGDTLREQFRRAKSTWAHLRRCRALGLAQPTDAEVASMVAAFHARGGRVTVCPPAHALPVQNGAGRDAARWTA